MNFKTTDQWLDARDAYYKSIVQDAPAMGAEWVDWMRDNRPRLDAALAVWDRANVRPRDLAGDKVTDSFR